MKRALLSALLLLMFAVPAFGQYGRDRYHGDRDARGTVMRWYERFLGRPADPYAEGWVQALQSGQSPEQVLAGLLGSDEYYRRTGGRPHTFVRGLYEDLTGRPPSPQEERHWAQQVYHRSRADIAHAILTRQAQNWEWDDRDRDRDRDRGRDRYDRYDYRRPSYRYR